MSRDEINRALFPAIKHRPGPESLVLRDVLEYLNVAVAGCVAWRQNTGGMKYTRADGKPGTVRFGIPGQADITGLLRGFRLEVEAKASGKTPTPLQEAWLGSIREAGGVAFWCDSVAACIERLREEFERRGWK